MIPLTTGRIVLCVLLVLGGFVLFFLISKAGERLLARQERSENEQEEVTA